MSRIGLVLGAGGLAGQAFQGGVLSTLSEELGWDPRSAGVIVGTSAGSFSGALLRLGVPACDLAAWAAQEALSAESQRLVEMAGAFPDPPALRPLELVGLPR